MKPEKDKKYFIACLGPWDYNRWAGIATFNGHIDNADSQDEIQDPVLYGFDGVDDTEECWFAECDIIAEAKS